MQLPLLQALTSILPFTPAIFTMPDWKPELESSLSKQKVNYLSLSTVAAPLVPRARMVTFSGFLGNTPVITTATQKKSQKYHELTTVSDAIEAVFWFPEEFVQVRVKGKGVPLGYYDDEEELGGKEKVEKYLGRELDLKKEVMGMWEKQVQHTKSMYPPPTAAMPVPRGFVVVCLLPEEVEVFAPGRKEKNTWKMGTEAEQPIWSKL